MTERAGRRCFAAGRPLEQRDMSRKRDDETSPELTPTQQDARTIARLFAAQHPLIAISTDEEDHALRLVLDAALPLGHAPMAWSASRGLYDARFLDGGGEIPETENAAAALVHLTRRIKQPSVAVMLDLCGHLEDRRKLRALREAVGSYASGGGTVVLIDHADALPSVIETMAMRVELSLPDEGELETIVRQTVRRLHQHKPITIDLRRVQLEAIVRNLRGLNRAQAQRVITDCVAEDRRLDADDVAHVLALKRQTVSAAFGGRLLEFVETPDDLSGIGGLENLKRWLAQRRDGFGEDAAKWGLRPPRGVLLLGVPGSGKSLCAKAIAAAWHLPLMRMDPGALFDRYIGETEKRLRTALHQAERMAPVVLWIDEIEKGFASASSQSNDGGVSQRMFGSLLTWMQERTDPVFLVATANDIGALPPELLRRGRFDEIFFVDLPQADARREIVSIHLRRRGRDPGVFDLDAIVAAGDGRSGAELEQAVIAALHAAFPQRREPTTADLVHALESSPPIAVTMAERIAALRRWAKSRCVMAD